MREGESGASSVICVHGAGAGGWEWAIWARVLGARGLRVAAPDLEPGAAGLAATTLADYRAQVIGWCAGSADPVLIGASLGGLLALAVAATVRARALVLVNPLPPAGILARPLGEPRGAIVSWAGARSIAATWRAMPAADDAARLFAFRHWRDESGAVLNEARQGVAIDPPRCPVLVLAGERDTEVPAAVGRGLAIRLNADFEMLHGQGHLAPLLGRPAAACAERVADWLRGL